MNTGEKEDKQKTTRTETTGREEDLKKTVKKQVEEVTHNSSKRGISELVGPLVPALLTGPAGVDFVSLFNDDTLQN